MWRSPVAHLLWEQRVAGSNPVAPTSLINDLREPATGRLFPGRGLLPGDCSVFCSFGDVSCPPIQQRDRGGDRYA